MATSLTSTGVVFPDATVQTTAATSAGGTFEAVASGSLSNGSKVVINTDGTVSVVAGVAQSVGTPVVFESANTNEQMFPLYDSSSNKIVIVYRDAGNSNYGTAVVGTVSGTSISFGTPVVFQSASSSPRRPVYDVANNKIVIFYRTTVGRVVVGSVSGTSISFGSAANTLNFDYLDSAYDSANQKVVIAFSDSSNSSYGTAAVGTVSGTSISFGTKVVFSSFFQRNITCSYDSNASKVLISYTESSPTKSVVATVSGTSISYGSSATINAASSTPRSSIYDTSNNKTALMFSDGFGALYIIVITISGTTISSGTPVLIDSASNIGYGTYDSTAESIVFVYREPATPATRINTGYISGTTISLGPPLTFSNTSLTFFFPAYDQNSDKTIVAYPNSANSNYGTAVVFQNQSTNLTAENFIGISDGAYTNGQTATVLIAGSVSEAQSGLTAGQVYYVQKDGTLSTTPDDPSVYAGTAIAATKLIVQG